MKPPSLPKIGDAVEVHDTDVSDKWVRGEVKSVSSTHVTIVARGATHHVPLDWYREHMGWRWSNHAS